MSDNKWFGSVWENAQIPAEEWDNVDVHNIFKPSSRRIMKISYEDDTEFTFRVDFRYPARFGQFCMISMPRFMEMPIFISGQGENWIEFTVQKITQLTDSLFKLREGDLIQLRGPFGKPWPLDLLKGADQNLVVIAPETGLCAVRTLIEAFHQAPDQIRSLYMISSFKDEKGILYARDKERWQAHPHFHILYTLTDCFSQGFGAGECASHLRSVPFDSFDGNYHVVIAGPQQIMQKTAGVCEELGIPDEKIWILLERKMYCAAGKCGHCKINETYVCLEGPVFPYTKAKTLFD